MSYYFLLQQKLSFNGLFKLKFIPPRWGYPFSKLLNPRMSKPYFSPTPWISRLDFPYPLGCLFWKEKTLPPGCPISSTWGIRSSSGKAQWVINLFVSNFCLQKIELSKNLSEKFPKLMYQVMTLFVRKNGGEKLVKTPLFSSFWDE